MGTVTGDMCLPAVKAGPFGSASATELYTCLVCGLARHNRNVEGRDEAILQWQNLPHPSRGVIGQTGYLVVLQGAVIPVAWMLDNNQPVIDGFNRMRFQIPVAC